MLSKRRLTDVMVILLVTVIVTAVAWVYFLPDAEHYDQQFRAENALLVGLGALGWFNLLLGASQMPTLDEPSGSRSHGSLTLIDSTFHPLIFVLAVLVGIGIGFLFVKVLRQKEARSALGILFMINCGCCSTGNAIVLSDDDWKDARISEPRTCEEFISETRGLRVNTYFRSHNTSNSFLSVTSDGGQTWDLFARTGGWFSYPSCNGVESFDENFFWVKTGRFWIYTHDGGENWQFWHPSQLTPAIEDIELLGISSVEFVNRQNGTLLLSRMVRGGYWQPYLNLYTEDGGFTWMPAQ